MLSFEAFKAQLDRNLVWPSNEILVKSLYNEINSREDAQTLSSYQMLTAYLDLEDYMGY